MMQHIVARVATTHLVLTLIGAATSSGSVTTIICHGYSLSGEKGPWVQTMCEAMQMRAIDEGTATAGAIVRYDQASGAWRLVSGTIDPNEPIFCIFRWLEDFDKPGPNIGYAEASSDAMYAALSDARFIDQLGDPIAGFDLVDDRDLHVVGDWYWEGTHYERTANAWLANLDRRRDEATAALATAMPAGEAERWTTRWRIFFMACAELFGLRDGAEWGVAHHLLARS